MTDLPPRTPSPPSAATFFPIKPQTDETDTNRDTNIQRDIVLLTTLLQDVRRHDKASILGATQPPRTALELWSHIAYVLSPGTKDDMYGTDVVAVNGRLEVNCVTITVARNLSVQHSTHIRDQAIALDNVKLLRPEKVITDIFRKQDEPPDKNIKFETHLRDVMSIISFVLRRHPTGEDEEKTYLNVYHFVVAQCYRKLFARLQTQETCLLWEKHPLVALRDFYAPVASPQESSPSAPPADAPQPSAAFAHESPTRVSPVTQRSFTPMIADADPLPVTLRHRLWYIPLLESHGIYPDETSSTGVVRYMVSASTAPAWARLLHYCYTVMVATLSDGNGKAAWPDYSQRVLLRPALAVLDDSLDSGIVAYLFVDELVSKLNAQHELKMQERLRPQLARAITRVTKRDVKIEFGHEYEADDLKTSGQEDTRHHIIRHLQGLVIPLRAAMNIVRTCLALPKEVSRLKPYQLIVTPDKVGLAVPEGYFDRFKERFATWCRLDVRMVKGALNGLQGFATQLKASVHAEAALMRVLHAFKGGAEEELPDICSFDDPIPIGVSKRCCYCCYLLAGLLIPGSGVAATNGFVLSGTHGSIVPWAPPPGLSREVLCEMRTKLLDILLEVFRSSCIVPRSTQTSLARSDSVLEDGDAVQLSMDEVRDMQSLTEYSTNDNDNDDDDDDDYYDGDDDDNDNYNDNDALQITLD